MARTVENGSTYVGPREDQVKGRPGFFSVIEYSAAIMSGETNAPTPGEEER